MHQYDPPDCVSDVTMKTSRRTLEFTNDSVVEKQQQEQQPVEDLDQLECKEEFFLEDDDDDLL